MHSCTPTLTPASSVCVQAAAPRRTPLLVQNIRVNNVEIPNNKRIEVSLQYIYGIGQTTAQHILRDIVSGKPPQLLAQGSLRAHEAARSSRLAAPHAFASSSLPQSRACWSPPAHRVL